MTDMYMRMGIYEKYYSVGERSFVSILFKLAGIRAGLLFSVVKSRRFEREPLREDRNWF